MLTTVSRQQNSLSLLCTEAASWLTSVPALSPWCCYFTVLYPAYLHMQLFQWFFSTVC